MNFALLAAWVWAATPVTLDEVRTQSRANAQVLGAQLASARAEQDLRLARSAILPRVDLNAQAQAAWQGPQRYFLVDQVIDAEAATFGNYNLSVGLSQLLYDGGRWWAELARAGAVADAQQGQLAEQRLAVELEGVRRFFELYRAQEVLLVLEQNVRRSEAQLELAQAMVRAGRQPPQAVSAAEVNLAQDELVVLDQHGRIVAAQGQLSVWLSFDGTTQLLAQAPGMSSTPGEPPSLQQALEAARQRRPLLVALDRQLDAAEHGVTVARSVYWPRVAVSAAAGRQSPTANPFFTDPTRQNYAQAGLVISWNLFAGFAQSAGVEQARLSLRQAESDLAQGRRELEAEVRSMVTALTVRIQAVAVAQRSLEAARQGLQFAEDRFKAGLATTLEVRDAQLKLTQAELSLLQNRIDVEVAREAVTRSVGERFDPS
jgi:outer membrane protein